MTLIILALPLLIEGSMYLEVNKWNHTDFETICKMKPMEVKAQYGWLTYALYSQGKSFDYWSEALLDQFMCTQNYCPCLLYDVGPEKMSVDSMQIYQDIPAERLAMHDRTFNAYVQSSKNFMFFTSGKNMEGFKSMKECLHHHDLMVNGRANNIF